MDRAISPANKCSWLIRLLLCTCLCAGSIQSTTGSLRGAVKRPTIPSAVGFKYESLPDPKISDDFDGKVVDVTEKWTYRVDGANDDVWGQDTSFVSIGSHRGSGDRFLSLKGCRQSMKGSGIATRSPVRYGFYMVRWQVKNLRGDLPTGWHPAIWGAACNFAQDLQCIAEENTEKERLEMDFVEGFDGFNATWKSHALFWSGGDRCQRRYFDRQFLPNSCDWPNHGPHHWKIMGLEYNANYLAVWVFDSNNNNKWYRQKLLRFSSRVGQKYRTDLYWILSLKRSNYNADVIDRDAWLHVDYFHFYPLRRSSSLPIITLANPFEQ